MLILISIKKTEESVTLGIFVLYLALDRIKALLNVNTIVWESRTPKYQRKIIIVIIAEIDVKFYKSCLLFRKVFSKCTLTFREIYWSHEYRMYRSTLLIQSWPVCKDQFWGKMLETGWRNIFVRMVLFYSHDCSLLFSLINDSAHIVMLLIVIAYR